MYSLMKGRVRCDTFRLTMLLVVVLPLMVGCGDDDPQGPGPGQQTEVVGLRADQRVYVDRIAIASSGLEGRVEVSLNFGAGNSGKIATLNWEDPDDPADSDTIDPNYDGDSPDNGYRGTDEEYLPVTTASFVDGSGSPIPFPEVENDGFLVFWFEPGHDVNWTYHPGDNWIIKGDVDGTVLKDTVSSWKRALIEYDRFSNCEIPDKGWWAMQQVFEGLDFSKNRDFNRFPYIEFKNDNAHLWKSNSDISASSYAIHDSYYGTSSKNLRDTYRSDRANWPLYVVAADSMWGDPTCAGIAFGPLMGDSFPISTAEDSVKQMTVIFVESLKSLAQGVGLAGDSVDWIIGTTAVHELGHFAWYFEHTGHSSVDCIMTNTRTMRGELSEPRFCSRCIKGIRGVPRLRGPIVF